MGRQSRVKRERRGRTVGVVVVPDDRLETLADVRVDDDAVASWVGQLDLLSGAFKEERPPDVDTPHLRVWYPREGDEAIVPGDSLADVNRLVTWYTMQAEGQLPLRGGDGTRTLVIPVLGLLKGAVQVEGVGYSAAYRVVIEGMGVIGTDRLRVPDAEAGREWLLGKFSAVAGDLENLEVIDGDTIRAELDAAAEHRRVP